MKSYKFAHNGIDNFLHFFPSRFPFSPSFAPRFRLVRLLAEFDFFFSVAVFAEPSECRQIRASDAVSARRERYAKLFFVTNDRRGLGTERRGRERRAARGADK